MNIYKKVLFAFLICLLTINSISVNATEMVKIIELSKDAVNAGINKNGILYILVTPDAETNFTSNELIILNPKNDKTQSRNLQKLASSIVFSKKKNTGYLVGEQGISIIDGKRNKLKKIRNVEIDDFNNSIVLDEKNMQLFVANGFSGISVFSSKNLKPIKSGVIGDFVDDLALDEANDRLYISDQGHLLSVIDINTLEVINTIDLIKKGISADENSVTIINDLAVDVKGRVYFSLKQGSPQFGYYDLNSDSVIEIPLTLSNGDSPGLINFDYKADTDKIYIQSCVNPAGKEDEILVIDGNTQQVSERVKNDSFIIKEIFDFDCDTEFYFSRKDKKIYEIEAGNKNVLVLESD